MNDHFGIGAFLTVLIIILQSILGSYFSEKNFRYFHQTGIAIVLGIAVSAFAYYVLDYQVKLEKKVFVFIFLPAIVFAEGYSLKRKIFFHNMMYIFIYGFLGTIITFSFLAASINYLCNNDLIIVERGNKDMVSDGLQGQSLQLNSKDIILLSAALSSKDSFLASTMVNHHFFPTLFHIIFGEGIMNDATSLILFESFEVLIESESNFTWGTIPNVFVVFLKSFLISILSGTFFGVLCTLILKHFEFINKNVIHESLIVFMCSYSGYCIIEYFNLSGIISLLVSGFIIGYYGFHNLSDKAKMCANITFQTISCGAENFLFTFVGFTTFSFYRNAWSFSLIGWIVLILLVSRIVQVFVVSAIFRLFYRKTPFLVKFREQIVICLTGISRGILGFILVDQIHSDDYKDILNSTMIGVLITTTLFFGLINPKLIDCILPPPKDHTNNSQIQHDKIDKKDIESKEEVEVYKLYKAQILKPTQVQDEEVQIRKAVTQIVKQSSKTNSEIIQDEENLSDTDYFIIKKQKIDLLLNNVYDEKLFGSKIQFKFSRFNEKYLKTFLIRNYQQKLDDFIVANRILREDRIQLTRPMGSNRNSDFITNNLQKLKTTFQIVQSQKLTQVNQLTISQANQKQQEQLQSSSEIQLKPIQTEFNNIKEDQNKSNQSYNINSKEDENKQQAEI